MKRSTDRIRTTHTGSLPRPADMLAALHARFEGGRVDEAAYERRSTRNVREIVRKQVEAGIDIVSDGECGKPSFMAYRAERIGGFEPRIPKGGMPAPGPVDPNGRDATMFPEYYRNVQEHSPFAQHDAGGAAGVRGADQVRRPEIPAARHRQPEAGHVRGRSRRGVHAFGEPDPERRERALQVAKTSTSGPRRSDARGIQGDPRRRPRTCRSTIRGW